MLLIPTDPPRELSHCLIRLKHYAFFFQGDLGYLYLDLYSRKGKYPGCANFAIKGGRRISETEYQLPVC